MLKHALFLVLMLLSAMARASESHKYNQTKYYRTPSASKIVLLNHQMATEGYRPILLRTSGNYFSGVDQIYQRDKVVILVKFGLELTPVHKETSFQLEDKLDGLVVHDFIQDVPFAAAILHADAETTSKIKELLSGKSQKTALRLSLFPYAYACDAECLVADKSISTLQQISTQTLTASFLTQAKTCVYNGAHKIGDQITRLPEEISKNFETLLTNPKAYWISAVKKYNQIVEFASQIDKKLTEAAEILQGLDAATVNMLACELGGQMAALFITGLGAKGAIKATAFLVDFLNKLKILKPLLTNLKTLKDSEKEIVLSTALKCGA